MRVYHITGRALFLSTGERTTNRLGTLRNGGVTTFGGTMTRKTRNAAAGVLASMLSLLVAPAALGASAATVEPAPGWEQNKSYLEYLEQQEAAQMQKAQVEYQERQAADAAQTSTARQADAKRLQAQVEYLERQQQAAESSTTGSTDAQMPKAQVEYQERLAAADSGESTDGPGWLLGAGAVTAVAIGSVVVAAIRSRRPEPATPVEREREKLTV